MKFNSGKLRVTLPSDCEIQVTREFPAPRPLVFEANTKPEMLKRWLLGPEGWSMVVCEIDLRVGGKYRYVWRHQDGREFGLGGKYLEVTPPEKIASTERLEGALDAGEAHNTLVLTECNGKTTVTLTMRFPSKEARDGALKSGMNEGIEAGYARLENLLVGSAHANTARK